MNSLWPLCYLEITIKIFSGGQQNIMKKGQRIKKSDVATH